MRGFLSHNGRFGGIPILHSDTLSDTLGSRPTKFERATSVGMTIHITMTIDHEIPRTRSDGKKGKGNGKKGKEKEVYSAKHVRLSLALASANKNK